MFCTRCKTAFGWLKGNIDSVPVHNAHYFQYNRESARVREECGGLPTLERLMNVLQTTVPEIMEGLEQKQLDCQNKSVVIEDLALTCINAYKLCVHIDRVEIPFNTTDGVVINRPLRIKFLIGDITEMSFKTRLQRLDEARLRKRDSPSVADA